MTISATQTLNLNRRISDNVGTVLGWLRLSERAFAESTGINASTVHSRMRGVTEWKANELPLVWEALGLEMHELLGTLPDFEEWSARVRRQGLEPRTR